ncbi:MAG: lytic transglycosylase domain-containing protein [Burkholderiales bacterium]|nr:lytic transglycosylase domain-containing protein [Burkholderiales bacterium]
MPDDPRFKLYMKTQKEASPVTQAMEQRNHPLPKVARDRYHGHVVAAAKTFSLEPALIHAVITAESAYNPLARSPKGAKGLMQLMPGTAERYGVKNPLDPKQNILGGAAYLRDLLTLFGNDMQLALAAYNAGEGAVARHGGRIPPYRETLEYVPKVLSYYKRYKSSM